ncbi:MAG: heme NO-binding domain-containing protein [Deltaproteobacteria bacterium]
MKGIVFNLLEETVRREYGEDTWDSLLEEARLDGVYTSLGNYPDEDLIKLIRAASSALDMPRDAIVRWFGRNAFPLFTQRYPKFMEGHKSTRPFLLTLNNIIHPEVRKIYPGADVPEFDYDVSSEEVLVMGYSSARRLCAFAEGLIEGAAAHYGEDVIIEQPKCMNRGDEKCILRISFRKR